MKYNDIRNMAKRMGINPYRMKKTELIQAIQRGENNTDCYGTPRVEKCNENGCLWREDCLSLNQKGI
jgi:hypothetical protein